MIVIKEIAENAEKSRICEKILRALPDWFENEQGLKEYVENVSVLPFWAAIDEGLEVGFISIKLQNKYTAELFVTGILPEYHRKGIGRKMLEICEKFCVDNKIEYLTVKTLDESREDKSYEATRKFYLALGFRPLEVFKTYWDEDNPCLFMAKYIAGEGI